MRWDYIIVGQGLAGSVLAYTMRSHGQNVLVIDDPQQHQASAAAAGIYNPFTGRNMVKTWMLDLLFPFLEGFYHQMSKDLQVKLLYPTPMYRPFLSLKELNEWGSKIHDPAYSNYIDAVVSSEDAPDAVPSPWGGMLLTNCGYVNTMNLIQASRDNLIQQGCYLAEQFNYQNLSIESNSISYKGQKASKIIFCEGPNLSNNPYFNWLPLRPVKGETLLIELDEPLSFIVNRGIFVLPFDGVHCKVGSTFDHSKLNWKPSDSGKTELETKLKKLINLPYKITDQQAGIRPATEDRRPFIGIHAQHEPLGVFNGLGTKGISLAPYFAQMFFELLVQGKPLLKDVSINRYF